MKDESMCMRWEKDNNLHPLGPLGLFQEYLSMGQFCVFLLVSSRIGSQSVVALLTLWAISPLPPWPSQYYANCQQVAQLSQRDRGVGWVSMTEI